MNPIVFPLVKISKKQVRRIITLFRDLVKIVTTRLKSSADNSSK